MEAAVLPQFAHPLQREDDALGDRDPGGGARRGWNRCAKARSGWGCPLGPIYASPVQTPSPRPSNGGAIVSDSKLQALVIGAGPTGLTAAAALAKAGVSFRIVDKNAAPSSHSKALAVQSGTLECLQAALGQPFVDGMLHAGLAVREGWVHLSDKAPIRLNIGAIPSRYNHMLMLEQSQTERLLEGEVTRLGGRVERNVELLDATPGADAVVCRLRHADGRVEDVAAQYVLGCDGAHSPIRHAMGVPFVGGAYDGSFILGDVQVAWDWPGRFMRLFISARGLIGAFPLRGEGRHRLILVPKTEPASDQMDITFEEFGGVLERLSLGTMRITSAHWLTRFNIHHRHVQRYRQGRMLDR